MVSVVDANGNVVFEGQAIIDGNGDVLLAGASDQDITVITNDDGYSNVIDADIGYVFLQHAAGSFLVIDPCGSGRDPGGGGLDPGGNRVCGNPL